MLTSEVLDRAADLIEEHGWTTGLKGLGGDPAGLCLEGGLIAALGISRRDTHARGLMYMGECPVYTAVADYLAVGVGRLWHWNDVHARSASEVVAVLRAASAVESARESELAAVSA